MAEEALDHLVTAVDTYLVITRKSGASEDWKRSARENLLRELEQYRETQEGEIIGRQRALLRRVLEHLDPESGLAVEVREELGDLPVPS